MLIHWKRAKSSNILLTVATSSMLLWLFLETAGNAKNSVSHQSFSEDSGSSDIPFVLIICKGGGSTKDTVFTEEEMQIRQVKVHLKSAVALASKRITYIIICDHYPLFEAIEAHVASWPAKYQKMLRLQYRPLYVPPYGDILKIYAKCATERLFMPWALPDVNSAVFLDTDTLFMRSPEDLRDLILDFDEEQLMGAVQVDAFYLQPHIQIPYYGERGMCGTPLVANLTRWRQLPFDWFLLVKEVWQGFKDRPGTGGGQDILNVIFSEFPQYIYDIGCEWNGSMDQCMALHWPCEDIEQRGFSLVHGFRWRFFRELLDWDSRLLLPMRAIFLAWEHHPLGEPVSVLFNTILQRLTLINEEALKPRLVNGLTTEGAPICDFNFRKLLKPLEEAARMSEGVPRAS